MPNVIHKQYDEAVDIMGKVGLTIEVADTGYVKELPPDCILEQSPVGGKRIKSTHVVYVTINAASAPSLVIPDIIDNNSLREAQAQLLSMGFKVGEPEYIPGEKDWIYGILVKGNTVMITKLKNVADGRVLERTFQVGFKLEDVRVERG